jgi:putative transposase
MTRYDRIVLEDLQIGNLVRNHRLSKNILDSGWGYLRTHLAHKAEEAGRELLLVNPANTTKTCSCCRTFFEHLMLADRWVRCACGLSMARDENTALNLLKLGRNLWRSTWPTAACVRQVAAAL